MTAHPHPSAFVLDDFLRQQQDKDLLRFVVCGSVDHGKSTLIGRLLYEARLVFDDQLDTLKAESRRHGTQGGDLDFSLLLDGLAAEREQKITIDIAYRFFSTARRKFIVADAPGHEQYTRNMATGASTADCALILVNAQSGLTRQTRRHSLIVSTFGIRHIVVAVNKMDLVGWSQDAFRRIEDEFRALQDDLGVGEIVCIPTAAKSGDNIVARSAQTGWYRGPTLLEHLEDVDVRHAQRRQPFRMPVQGVNRPSADFRGYNGLIAAGEVTPGMPVRILPSGRTSTVARIVTFDGDRARASAQQSVTLTLADEIDASRGDVIAALDDPPAVTDRIDARILWMGEGALKPGVRYLLKLGTATVSAAAEPGLRVLDLDTRRASAAGELAPNEIGDVSLSLDRAVAADRFADGSFAGDDRLGGVRELGTFILIDRETFDTVGMGVVTGVGSAPADVADTQAPVLAALARRLRSLWPRRSA